MANLPPRKSVSMTCKPIHRSVPASSLQILLQMGIPKHRAEKALAATGDRGAQVAIDWLLAHVSDPTIDDSTPREYILYLCPTGPLLESLQKFYSQYLSESEWNGAHNYLPHITLCSFFQAPDDGVGTLISALEHCVARMRSELPAKIHLEKYTSEQFIGLFVTEEENDILKRLAMMFMRECKEFSDAGPLHVISTCFPWWSNFPSLGNPCVNKRIEVEPYLKSLHITLAYQYEAKDQAVLDRLLLDIDPNAEAVWEVRLYSREQRIKGHEVYKILCSHMPQQHDELELLVGDFVYVNGESIKNSPDGWIEGTSWLTGASGQLPINYIERTAESDAWTLHKCISISYGNGVPDDLSDITIGLSKQNEN